MSVMLMVVSDWRSARLKARCHLYHLMLQQKPGVFDILVPAYQVVLETGHQINVDS